MVRVFTTIALAALALVGSPAGARAPAAVRCQVAKLGAAARCAGSVLQCHVQAARSGDPADAQCVAQAHAPFEHAFARADDGGGCLTPGNAGEMEAALDAFVQDVADALPPDDDGCSAAKLGATGRRIASELRAHGRHKRKLDYGRLGRERARAESAFESSFDRADSSAHCPTEDDADDIAARVEAFVGKALCGDHTRDVGERCDGPDDALCRGSCRADCTCPGPSPFACVTSQTGPLITLSGISTTDYRNHGLSAAARVDASRALFLAGPDNRYPINLGGGNGACLAGGAVFGQYGRRLSWQAMHDTNNAGVAFETPSFLVEGVRIDNVTDGVRVQDGPFTLRGAWLSYVRDDCVENDHLHGGLIDDVLFDGCYVGVSERPTDGAGYDGRAQVLTVRKSLIRLEPMPAPRDDRAGGIGHGGFFKWDTMATSVALQDNIFMVEQDSDTGTLAMPDRVASCSNNVMVWLGGGPFPKTLPSCFTVTTNRAVWDDAVAVWKARHPYVGVP
jgi:hypothetical protein